MKLTNRIKGWTYKPEPKQYTPGRELVTKTVIDEYGKSMQIVTYEEEQPISPLLKVSDYSLMAQIANGTFANQEQPINTGYDRLDTERLDAMMLELQEMKSHAEAQAAYERSKQQREQTTVNNQTSTADV